eukprot:scaffold24746_cov71-Skeletonema_marinoi.AAC.1
MYSWHRTTYGVKAALQQSHDTNANVGSPGCGVLQGGKAAGVLTLYVGERLSARPCTAPYCLSFYVGPQYD